MAERNDGGPAFPIPHVVADANDPAFKLGAAGMSLRDWFAGQALPVLINNRSENTVRDDADEAYAYADAMLAAREVPVARRKQRDPKLRALAERIARDLFTNGGGERAQRFVLELPDGRNGGGWIEAAAADRIEDALARHMESKHPTYSGEVQNG